MKTRLLTSVCFAAAMVGFVAAHADVRLPEIFNNNMVLQRDMPVPVWGWADPGEEVAVAFDTQNITITADADGKWAVQFTPLKANAEPAVLTVKGKNEIRLTNVLVGDVWLCSGQSNMEWPMRAADKAEYEEVLKTVDNPNIRLFHVTRAFSPDPVDKLPVASSWRPSSAEAIPNFSAVALHFGRKLQTELDVPIGLINSSWGGTRIEPWIPPVGFQDIPALNWFVRELDARNPQSKTYKKLVEKSLQDMQEWIEETKKATGRISPPPFPNQLIPYAHQQQPAVLYNSMVHPIVPFAMKGAIWYQGEANVEEGMLYAEKMKALIQGWRKVFNNDDFGFYYVQLAPYIYGAAREQRLAEFWEAQSAVEKMLPKTGQAIINDTVDDLRDIHPVRKKPVGERLALLALNRTYSKSEVVCASPEFDKMSIEGNTLIVSFKNVKTLKTRDSKSPDWFEIAGADGIYHKAGAVIDGTTIKLTSSDVTRPIAVRYAWDQSAQPNVQNEAGLPLGAFRAGTIPE